MENISPKAAYEEWRKNTKRGFFLLMGGIVGAWIAAGVFTVWLLRG